MAAVVESLLFNTLFVPQVMQVQREEVSIQLLTYERLQLEKSVTSIDHHIEIFSHSHPYFHSQLPYFRLLIKLVIYQSTLY